MKYLKTFIIVVLFVSCKNNNDTPAIIDFCCCENEEYQMFVSDYWSCEQLLDTTGLKLYPFVPFTDDEWRQMSYDYKLERRQIPTDFLCKMTTKELFYQVAYTELSFRMLNSPDKRLNMVTELLNRPNAGCTLIEILGHINPVHISDDGKIWPETSCWWMNHCLQIIAGQPEVINSMTDADIDNYIVQQMRCLETHRNLCENSDDEYCYCENVYLILYGLGNVMIRYKFEPFIQSLLRNPETNELIWQLPTAQQALRCNFQVINYIEQFLNK